MLKICVGDKIRVVKGKDKGKDAIVSKVIRKKKNYKSKQLFVLLEGINVAKKHTKPNPNKNKTGGILKIDVPISYSNVSIINSTTKKIDRVGFKFLDSGKKVRVYKSNGEIIG